MKFKIYFKALLILGVTLPFFNQLFAQKGESIWRDASTLEFPEKCYMESLPRSFRVLDLNLAAIKSELNQAVYDSDPNAFINGPVISLPLPEGGYGRFKVARSEVLPDNSTPSYSNVIRTFTAIGIDDKYATAKLDYTIFGFHALVMTPSGWFAIDPYSLTNVSHYISFYRRDRTTPSNFTCETEDGLLHKVDPHQISNPSANRTSGANLKTYRLALSCTGEYAAFFGGTQAGALSAMVTSVNRVTGVYELEVAVRLVLIANTSLLIYTNSATDPFTNGTGGTMLGENQTTITSIIGSANYDIGHVFSTGGGGVAYLGCVCNASNKAGGVTGSSSPVGDNYDIDYVAHEMGHQFAGNHTFNGTLGSCAGGNRNGSTAYEPGSGTTIMAYAGICGTDDTQPHSDAIFHVKSLDEILTFVTTGNGNTCATSSATGNTAPVITIPGNYSIPYLTPFSLTGSATDINGDALTYIWEEYDLGAAAQVSATQTVGSTFPIFRDFTPQTTGTRIFPRISDIVNNISTVGERLPAVARTMNFRFTARDNRLNGGAISNNDTPVQVAIVVTPDTFLVKQPNTALTWFSSSTQTVLWDVSGTTAAPISCANVNIFLSTDGGYTYPYTLATGVPNNGTASITVPAILSTTARIKVAGAGTIFFDISDVNFTIASGSAVLTVLSTNTISPTSICAGSSVSVGFTGDGPPNAGNIYTAQLSNAAGSFAAPVTIGTLSSVATAATISCVIPGITVVGSAYRIRVISSTPAIVGTDNGANLSVLQAIGAAGSISGVSTVCAGQTGVVYSVAAIANASTYNWTLPSGASITSGSSTNSITVTFSALSVSGTVTVTGVSTCGTGATSPAFNVVVNPLPTALDAITGNAAVCLGQITSFSVPVNGTAVSYSWTLPVGGTILTGSGTNVITASFSSAITGSISVSGVNSCGSGAASTLPINVIALPAAPTISAGGATTFCVGGSVSLSFTPVAGDIYQWRKNGTLIGGATSSPYVANTAGGYDLATWTKQIYTNATAVSIPDNICTGVSSPITISGYTGTVASSGITISINLTHTYDADLILVLQAPNGSLLGLAKTIGSNGDNFTNTIFSDAGVAQIPATGAPYTGTYKPWTSIITTCTTTTVTTFGAIGAGAFNPNGTWNLIAMDNAAADVGTINSWSISIPASMNAPCYGTSNSIPVIVTPAPVISTFTPTSGSSGQTITINGSGFTGASNVSFNGISAAYVVVSDILITAIVPAGSTTGLISVTTPCGTVNSLSNFNSDITLNLKVYIEGYYSSASLMRSALGGSVCDSIEVRLASSISPYSILYTVKGVINTSGNGVFTLPGSVLGGSYFIVVKHRNSLETWSGGAIPLPSVLNSFDFTTLATQAYGGNLIQVAAGKWAIRSGDVNQDGVINHTDFANIQSALLTWLAGYQINDITGDNFVESTDYSLVETNSRLTLTIQKP